MGCHRSRRAGQRGTRGGAALVLAAALLGGCGGVSLGADPEAPTQASPADRAEPPEPGSEDWPDETVPLVTVELERRPPPPPDAGPTPAPAPDP